MGDARASGELPDGVRVHPLTLHQDHRGSFVELFRYSWPADTVPVQWNAARSEPNVLRGVHCHVRHRDYLTMAVGRMILGLRDLRHGSPTTGLVAVLEIDADRPTGVEIPPGVAHGFYFPEPALHVYAVSHEFDPTDELGCHWADPELGIAFPCDGPLLSTRDETAGSLAELITALDAAGLAASPSAARPTASPATTAAATDVSAHDGG